MKALFDITPGETVTEQCVLTCEVSGDTFSYAIREVSGSIVATGIFEYNAVSDGKEMSKTLGELLQHHDLLSRDFKRVNIVYSVPESVLIPYALYNNKYNSEVLQLLHGDIDADSKVFAESIKPYDLYNVYKVPAAMYEAVCSRYPYCRETHQYTAVLKQKDQPETDLLSVIFYRKKMVVSLYKDGRYVLINTYLFRQAEDVSYILLNIFREFNLTDIELRLSGLIEENSALYRDMYKYFEWITFDGFKTNDQVPENISTYPAQYFSHIFAFDTCE